MVEPELEAGEILGLLNAILSMDQKPDFIARVTYRTTEQGGRRSFTKSGHRSQIKFAFSEMQTSGQQIFINKDVVYPGETVEAAIKMASPHIFRKALCKAMTFELGEGPRIIGTGEILEIINEDLNS
jgi:translation elongation factor EF-Tu-like GTPase